MHRNHLMYFSTHFMGNMPSIRAQYGIELPGSLHAETQFSGGCLTAHVHVSGGLICSGCVQKCLLF